MKIPLNWRRHKARAYLLVEDPNRLGTFHIFHQNGAPIQKIKAIDIEDNFIYLNTQIRDIPEVIINGVEYSPKSR